jgi:hypothetical protein
MRCVHPSRRLLRKLLRMRSVFFTGSEEPQQADKSPYDLILRSGRLAASRRMAAGRMVRDARLRGLLTMRETSASPTGKSAIWLSSLISDFPKNISVPTPPKSNLEFSLSHPLQGRIAIVTDAGWDAVDAAAFCARWDCRAGWRKACERSTASGREMLQRTAKSCGPDAPMLASSSRRLVGPTGFRQNLNPLTTVAKEPGHRGARNKS